VLFINFLSVNQFILKQQSLFGSKPCRNFDADFSRSFEGVSRPVPNPIKTQVTGRHQKTGIKILIEFWESPFNFTGYKLSKSKLIVYGLDPNTNYFLRDRNNDTLELNSSDDSFNFVFTDDFRPLEPNLRDSL